MSVSVSVSVSVRVSVRVRVRVRGFKRGGVHPLPRPMCSALV